MHHVNNGLVSRTRDLSTIEVGHSPFGDCHPFLQPHPVYSFKNTYEQRSGKKDTFKQKI